MELWSVYKAVWLKREIYLDEMQGVWEQKFLNSVILLEIVII